MGWTLTPLSVVVFVSGAVSLAVAVAALRERPDPMAWPLAVMMIASAGWSIPHAISFGFTDIDQVSVFIRILSVSAPIAPVAYLVVAMKYAGYGRYLHRWVYALLLAVPFGTAVTVWTNDAHHLYWRSATVEQVGNASVYVSEAGPWYWITFAYGYSLLAISFIILGAVAINSDRIYRKQAVLMFVAGFIPALANIPVVLELDIAPPVDPTSSTLALSGVLFALALFRYDLLDLSPAAYRNVPDAFGDGMLVFDGEKRLVEANDHARRILDADLDIGMPADGVFDAPVEELDGTVVTTMEDIRRFYNVRYSPLSDHREAVIGHAVVMREVTELKDHEQRLSVTNRILRHNLRNELTIILGEADQLATADIDRTTSVERILEAGERLQDVSEKARHIQASMRFDDAALVSCDLVSVVESIVETYRGEFPEAEVSLDAPERAFVLASDDNALETAVRNVVENALQHNDSESPRAAVAVEVEDGAVRLSVADNGPGIPPAEQEILRDGHETQLEHGSSLGLWLVYWFVSAMGGKVSFADREPRGTVVTLTFRGSEEPPSEPAADPARRLAPKSVETD
ncbi:hypothetical protein BRC87_04160 [Halobacteriales archaeon QS_4_66_20]|nr:MAG: hypothetical protein BRC87_04160 [Halobacteriales archaeon QS_4_66_20]